MIVKSLSRKSNSGQLVKYIFKYVFREQDKNIAETKPEKSKSDKNKFIIRHNVRSRSLNGFINEFKENESYRLVHRKDSVMLFHNIISFSNKDKEHITDPLLKDIAKKFIEERGLNNMYAGTKHEDKNHVHLHIAISGTQLNGRSSRISKQKLHSIKLALDKYQRERYPQLKHSLPEHGKSKRLEKEAIVQTIKIGRQTDKQSLLKCLEKAYSTSKSEEQFISQIKDAGHEPYFRNGTFQGVRFEGKMKFRLTRLGFDKARLQGLDKIKKTQIKALNDLQKLRADRNKDQKRTITKPPIDKQIPETLDRNEKQLQELSAIRSGNEDKELCGGDINEDRSIAPAEEELDNGREEEQEDTNEIENEENSEDEDDSEME